MAEVGFIGLGRMGVPMCRNLLAAGHDLVVFNRTAAKAEPLIAAGARVAESVAALAESCDVVITCLDTVAASEQVALGSDGVIARARANAVLIEHSTITPELAIAIGNTARARGLAFLDAPVSGGPEGAAKGTLAIMVGGPVAAFEATFALMQVYGGTIARMGDVGSGTHAKLVNQLLTFTHGAAAAEALALAERTGLDVDALMQVLRASFGHSRMLDRTYERVQNDRFEAGAALSLYDKDLRIVADVGEAHGLRLSVTASVRMLLEAAISEGMGDRDIAALLLRYRENRSMGKRPAMGADGSKAEQSE